MCDVDRVLEILFIRKIFFVNNEFVVHNNNWLQIWLVKIEIDIEKSSR